MMLFNREIQNHPVVVLLAHRQFLHELVLILFLHKWDPLVSLVYSFAFARAQSESLFPCRAVTPANRTATKYHDLRSISQKITKLHLHNEDVEIVSAVVCTALFFGFSLYVGDVTR